MVIEVEKDLQNDPPCHARACAIQNCLMRSNYNEKKCQEQVDALYECCKQFYEKNGDDAHTSSCMKPDLLRLKMKQRAEEKEK